MTQRTGAVSSQLIRSYEEEIEDLISLGFSRRAAQTYLEFQKMPLDSIIPPGLPLDAFVGSALMLPVNIRDWIKYEQRTIHQPRQWGDLAARQVPAINIMLNERYRDPAVNSKFPERFNEMPLVYSWISQFVLGQ